MDDGDEACKQERNHQPAIDDRSRRQLRHIAKDRKATTSDEDFSLYVVDEVKLFLL